MSFTYRRSPDRIAAPALLTSGKSLLQYLSDLYRALTAAKNGPTVYDLCDPLLRGPGDGNAHLRKFYQTAIANPLLRPLLARAGLPQLRDPSRFDALRDAIVAARDQESPDWLAIGRPVADLLDQFPQRHPTRRPAAAAAEPVAVAEIDRIIHACARHLLGSFAKHGFIPAYAAFNLIGDPDFRGRDLLIALQGSTPAPTRTPHCCSIWRGPSSPARRPPRSSIRPGAAWPSRCGRRCKSAIARPTTTHSTPRR